MQLNVDLIIFLGFLAINLSVGLIYGRGVKTMKDYALGGRNFSTAALVATILATFMDGGGFFVALEKTYAQGLIYIIAALTVAIQLYIVATFLIPRMGEFMGSLSVAEVMGNLYGPRVRLITAISGILFNIGVIAVNFKVFGTLVNYFIGVSEFWGVIIAATIVILYSAFGGIRAVTYTDVLQFFTFGFVIPLIGIIIWNHFQKLNLDLSNAFANPLFNFHHLFTLPKDELMSFLFLIVYFLFPTIYPTDFQRISMGRSLQQVKSATLISIVLFVVILLANVWIPFLIASIDSTLDASNLTSYIINNYTTLGLKGLLIVGITAMAMSTSDSFLNGSAVLFAYDVTEVAGIKMDNLIVSKLFSLGLGIFGVYLALSTNDLLAMIQTTASFYMPVVAIPLLFSIFGFRSSTSTVLAAMGTGFIIVVTLMLLNVDEIIVPAMVGNLTVLFGYHYLLKQPGGWVGIKDYTYINEIKRIRKHRINEFISTIRNSRLIDFCKRTAPKDEMMYTWLGIYCIFFTISTMYSTQSTLKGANGDIILAIYQLMMCTGVITAMYPIWPPRVKYEAVMQVAWNIIIFYMLIFFSCFFVMLSGFELLQFAIFTINLIITAILIGWKLSFIMIPIGFYCSTVFYKYYAGVDNLNLSIGSPAFIFMYTLMLIGTSLIIFLKPKQEQYALTEEKNEHLSKRIFSSEQEVQNALAVRSEFLRNINHEYNTPITGIMSLSESLWHSFETLPVHEVKQSLEFIFKSARTIQNLDENIASISRLTKAGTFIEEKLIDFSKLVTGRLYVCRRFYEENTEEKEFYIDIQDNIIINGDDYYLMQAVDNLIINAITYCPKENIKIILRQDQPQKKAILIIKDEGIGIPKEELYDIFADFVVSSKTKTPAGGRGLGLALCKRVIELHKGTIVAESDGIKGAKFIITLPLAY